jgi:chondroitin 4-sulfotransferase 11
LSGDRHVVEHQNGDDRRLGRRIIAAVIPRKLSRALRAMRLERQHAGQIIALPEDKLLYYAIPKVASSSLLSVCVDALGIATPPDEWKPSVFRAHRYDHLYDREHILITGPLPRRYREFWSFAFVRNPWDRLVSCYSNKIRPDGPPDYFTNGVSRVLVPYGVFKGGMSFDSFVRAVAEIPDTEAESHFLSQHRFITGRTGTVLVDFVGRLEHLMDDLQQVLNRIHRPVMLPHLLRSQREDYRTYYSAELREIVGTRYARDLALFGYTF